MAVTVKSQAVSTVSTHSETKTGSVDLSPGHDTDVATAPTYPVDRTLLKHEHTVRTKWLKDPEQAKALGEMLDQGDITVVALSSNELENLYNNDRLLFRESEINTGRLSSISLPINPNRLDSGPVVLIKTEDDKLIVLNGNHRTFKVIYQDGARDNPLLAVRFENVESFNNLTGLKVSLAANGKWGWTSPKFV